LGNLVTDDAGNMYMKDNETGQYVPVSATEQGGQVVIQTNENFTQEPQVMQEDPDQLVAQIVDAGEPTPGGMSYSFVFINLFIRLINFFLNRRTAQSCIAIT